MGYIGSGVQRFNTADGLTVTGDATIDTTTLVVDSTNNNVGIGTASPEDFGGGYTTLEVAGSSTANGGIFKTATSDSAGTGTAGTEMLMYSNNGGGVITVTSSDPLLFQTAGAERMRLTSAGLLGLGTSSPDALLQIEKSDSGTTIDKEPSSQSGPNIAIHNSNQTANNLSSIQFTNRGTNGVAETATAGIHVKHEAQGGTYSYGSMNFNVTNSAGSYATRMHISSDGKVGISNSAPDFNLSVGNSSSVNPSIQIMSATNSNAQLLFGDGAGAAGYRGTIVYGNATDSMSFSTAGSERMRLDSNGNVGIGVSSMTNKLVLPNAAYFAMQDTSGAESLAIRANSSNAMELLTGGGVKATITSGGNVGIGTASPTSASGGKVLAVETTADEHTNLVFNTANTGRNGIIEGRRTGRSGSERFAQINIQNNSDSGEIRFYTASFGNDVSERARLSSAGVLLIGKTADSISNNGISLAGSATGGGNLSVTNDGNSALSLNRKTSEGSCAQFFFNGTVKGSIQVASAGTTFATTSDIRLKQDIEPLQATDKLMQMNPVSYNWKSDPDGPRSMGFIAQEIREVIPEAVSTGDDDMMSMDYGRITPILVSALQDAHRKIDELAAEIAELKAS